MTDSLKRFTDALAESYDGTSPTPAASRARVMRALRNRSGVRRRWLPWFLVPLLTLGAGTALAASGQLPKLVERVTTWLDGDRQVAEAEAEGALRKASPQHLASSPAASRNDVLTEPLPIPSATAAMEEEAVVGEPPEDGAPGGGVTSRSLKRSSRGAGSRTASDSRAALSKGTAAVEGAATPAPVGTAGASLSLYKEAQQTHFRRGDCAAAVGLYSRYLSTFPTGQFVLEAKYNQGICFLRLGRTEEARRALEPFAQGRHGGYRQAESKALLGTTRE